MMAAAAAAAAPPPPDVAGAVRSQRWEHVRTATASLPAPLSPALALAAARASRSLGDPTKAAALLREALPAAGELAPALRLELAECSLALNRSPMPALQPLLAAGVPTAQRRAAFRLIRTAAERLPLATVQSMPTVALPRSLQREVAALRAVRGKNVTAALAVLKERSDDAAAHRVASWLGTSQAMPPSATLDVAATMLGGGLWREAAAVLAELEPGEEGNARYRHAFLSGRAAYRLGRVEEAAGRYDQALALAQEPADRHTAAVQRARAAELLGQRAEAVRYWDIARTARPREVEGWDGGARARAALGRADEAAELLLRAPESVLAIAGPRLVAVLLACNHTEAAAQVLGRLPATTPVVGVLGVALALRQGNDAAARKAAAAVLAGPQNGEWRELVLDLLPPRDGVAPPLGPTTDRRLLAQHAAEWGPTPARAALAAALAADPAWAPLLAPMPAGAWPAPITALIAVGLEADAARVFPHLFPDGSPAALAASARALAEWGNGPAGLTAGERLWARLGVPAVLLPDELLPRLLPLELIAPTARAATVEQVPPAWLAAIVRRESRFDAAVRSGAGAIGIAQFVPEAARRLGAAPEELWDVDRALQLAGREVARLVALFGPRLEPVAAAYNAGEGVVGSWLGACPDRFTETLFAAAIPYRETAGYVLAVREGAMLARHLPAPRPQSAASLTLPAP